MSANEGKLFSNIAATTAAFTLRGGVYKVSALATFGGGSVKLSMLGPDALTWMEVDNTNSSFTAAGAGNVAIPPGQYRFTIATATAVYASISRIPGG
jgi:hypothetical protein